MEPVLDIFLGDVLVGSLETSKNDRNRFRFHSSYITAYPRPILGQLFEDDLERIHTSHVRLPPFFSNLLPEGPLRERIAANLGIKAVREFQLLAHLGEDLPGAVRAVPAVLPIDLDGNWAAGNDAPAQIRHTAQQQTSLRFSLAGVQLKFSMFRDRERGLTLPMHNGHGDWIVKLPDRRYAGVPENEHAMMFWARAAGIEVPDEFFLVPVNELHGLPGDVADMGGQAFAVKRFDRHIAPDGTVERIHQEDFAQILGIYPDEKYDHHNYETLGKIIFSTAGESAFLEYVRRLVFVALCGNADAHHKNWSLRYPDGIHAALAPAYDLLATIVYIPDDRLALNLNRNKSFESVSRASFDRLAGTVGMDSARLRVWAGECVDRIRSAWAQIGDDIPLAGDIKHVIETHWRRVPLAQGR